MRTMFGVLLGCFALCTAIAAAYESPPEKFGPVSPKDGVAVANRVDPMAEPALQWEASADVLKIDLDTGS